MLVPRQLTVDRGSIAFHHSRPRGWRSSSFSTPRRTISSSYLDSKSLVLSSHPRRRHCEHREWRRGRIVRIFAKTGISRSRLLCPTSSPPLPRETPEMTGRGSLSNVDTKQSYESARFSSLQIDSESLIYVSRFSLSLKSREFQALESRTREIWQWVQGQYLYPRICKKISYNQFWNVICNESWESIWYSMIYIW